MSNPTTPTDSTEATAPDGPGQTRREFVRRAALIGVPVVLATIPSRTVWARPRPAAGKTGGADGAATLDALSSGGSVNPSGGTARVKSLF
ncbi:MAG TPA: hypothetical protein VJ260_03645 [Vicinamibacterales bacterium]|nr:hypothetical protein [Vicinamibacterales bacterium]